MDQPDYREIAELFGIEVPTGAEEPEESDRDATPTELGQQRLIEGQYEKAIAHFRKAVEVSEGEEGSALLDLASAYSVGEMLPQAYRQYLKARRLQEQNPEPYLGMSDILRREGRWDASLQELKHVVELEPSNGYPHYKMADILHAAGHKIQALEAIQNAIFVAPDQSFYHFWMADLLIELRRFEEAVESLQAAVELSPGDDHLYLRTAIAFWGAGRPQDAIKAARLASDLNPDNLVPMALMFKMHRALGQHEEAQQLKARAERLDDYDLDKLLRLLREADIPL